MFARAPTLAWLLTALACLLTGAVVGEGWGQAAPPLALPTVGVVVTVEVAFEPTATPDPTPPPPGSTADPSPPVSTCDLFGAEAPPCGPADDAR